MLQFSNNLLLNLIDWFQYYSINRFLFITLLKMRSNYEINHFNGKYF